MLRGYSYLFPYLDGTTFPLVFLIGPLYFLYISYLINPCFRFKLYHILHFIPAVIILVLNLPYYLYDPNLKSEALKSFYELLQSGQVAQLDQSLLVRLFLLALQLTVYLIISHLLVKRFKSSAEKNISLEDAVDKINWMSKTTLFFGFYTAAFMIMLVGLMMVDSYYYIALDTTWLFFVSTFIHFASYSVTNKPKFEVEDIKEISSFEENQTEEKYKSSSLTNDQINEIHRQLSGLVEQEKIFLNEQIRISEVAEKLNVNSHHLSQVINQKENLNFFEYINKHRINESIRLIQEDKDESKKLLAIAFESGFNNKVSFNRTFKRITGKTPSQFRKSI